MSKTTVLREINVVLDDTEGKALHILLHIAKNSNVPNVRALDDLRSQLDTAYGKPKKRQPVADDDEVQESDEESNDAEE